MKKLWDWVSGKKSLSEGLVSEETSPRTVPQDSANKAEKTPPPSFVEVDREDCQVIQDKYQDLSKQQMLLGQLLLNYEERKQSILQAMEDLRDEIENEVQTLRKQHGIPLDDDNYSLNLPKGEEGVGAFIRDQHGKDNPDAPISLSKGETAMAVGKPSS